MLGPEVLDLALRVGNERGLGCSIRASRRVILGSEEAATDVPARGVDMECPSGLLGRRQSHEGSERSDRFWGAPLLTVMLIALLIHPIPHWAAGHWERIRNTLAGS